MKNKYLNPWSSTDTKLSYFNSQENEQPVVVSFELQGEKEDEKYNCLVVKPLDGCYNYIINNICVTQRAGAPYLKGVEEMFSDIVSYISYMDAEDIINTQASGLYEFQIRRAALTYLSALEKIEANNEKH